MNRQIVYRRWIGVVAKGGSLTFLLLLLAQVVLASQADTSAVAESPGQLVGWSTGLSDYLTTRPLDHQINPDVGTGPGRMLSSQSFSQINEQGFGDRQNSWAWSMRWWNGSLYVGVNRSFYCVQAAAAVAALPDLVRYPPTDPDVECTDRPQDLPLQAEIWRYTPETESWERVFQSPEDVEIPGHPGQYVARDIGFRDMIIFEEADGAEVLYVAGVSSRDFNPGVPPPRILRSMDGVTFEPVPQDPGTVLGDLNAVGFRSLEVYNGKLYVTAGVLYGDGILLEAENPAGGNDNFRVVSPPGIRVMEMEPFNGFLYLGLRDPENGYSVVRTDAIGTPPYTFTPIVTHGGFLQRPGKSALSMSVFKDRLYVGVDGPAELIRINPDGSWDLIVGTPRETPDGMKEPLSGFDRGFDYFLNGHIWRMAAYDGWLYVGTMDRSTSMRNIPVVGELLKPRMGFDLYASPDGRSYIPVTVTGFNDIFNFGVRTFAATPYGLFLGTANSYYGTQIWRGRLNEFRIYLPLVRVAGSHQAIRSMSPVMRGHSWVMQQ